MRELGDLRIHTKFGGKLQLESFLLDGPHFSSANFDEFFNKKAYCEAQNDNHIRIPW